MFLLSPIRASTDPKSEHTRPGLVSVQQMTYRLWYVARRMMRSRTPTWGYDSLYLSSFMHGLLWALRCGTLVVDSALVEDPEFRTTVRG